MKYQVYDVSGLNQEQLRQFAKIVLKCDYNPWDLPWYIVYNLESHKIPYHFLKCAHPTKTIAYERIHNYVTEPFVPIDVERMQL